MQPNQPISPLDASNSPDVEALFESSQPRPRMIGLAFPVMILFILVVPFVLRQTREHPVVGLLLLIPLGGFAVMSFMLKNFQRSMQDEVRNVEQLEELIQLRQWPAALSRSMSLLSAPMKSDGARLSTLIAFSSVLTRYHWFESARRVHDEILEARSAVDPSIVHTITVARAMTLLREDRLVDADSAIGELRRDVNRARDAARRAQTSAGKEIDTVAIRAIDSAGLALLELYRDIKTGHFDEAIELFESRMKLMRDQLSTRVADAWTLVARAYDAKARPTEAATAFRRATSLAPFAELSRRYPELVGLDRKFDLPRIPN